MAAIVGNIDVALISLYAFWLFFAALVIYLQRENMREGYPLVDEDGNEAPNQGPYPTLEPKTFKLPHGHGEKTVPDGRPERTLALRRTEAWSGSPFEPTGDPLADGVGPASWVARDDVLDLTEEGEPKIRPMAKLTDFALAYASSDPRGKPVLGDDGERAGEVADLWVDQAEHLVRYIEIKLDNRRGRRLLPMSLARIGRDAVKVHSLRAEQFRGVPKTKSADQITLLEEEKISAYWCGGKLYAAQDRLEPLI